LWSRAAAGLSEVLGLAKPPFNSSSELLDTTDKRPTKLPMLSYFGIAKMTPPFPFSSLKNQEKLEGKNCEVRKSTATPVAAPPAAPPPFAQFVSASVELPLLSLQSSSTISLSRCLFLTFDALLDHASLGLLVKSRVPHPLSFAISHASSQSLLGGGEPVETCFSGVFFLLRNSSQDS